MIESPEIKAVLASPKNEDPASPRPHQQVQVLLTIPSRRRVSLVTHSFRHRTKTSSAYGTNTLGAHTI